MPTFHVSRCAIVEERYQIEADTEEEALEIARGGESEPILSTFVDWLSEDFVIDEPDTTP